MTFPIKCYDLFWNAKQEYGGVNLVLSDGRRARLTTKHPAVLEFWTKLLQTHPVLYYTDVDSAGLCTARELPEAAQPVARNSTGWVG